ncbi:hypothetical protein GPECTOR_31g319 [Gonium pectorale]|uniref:protein-serine/threonine phosphatase n=1 Tax=Gonium pectorale TaxID=33097 RepID=A0A150GDN3_GONPE|nr:hypothetical protein GPECTOR_31g319 [Gonium pectorale]|eukprot:KXZ47957.1 hypothetical protein GPECTOR_31g319 [Gonium pectorale]
MAVTPIALTPSGLPLGLADLPRRPSRFHSPPRDQPADEPAAKRSRTEVKPEAAPVSQPTSSRWDRVRTPAATATGSADANQQQQPAAVKAEAQDAPQALSLPPNVLRWSADPGHPAAAGLLPPPESPVSDAGGDGADWEQGGGAPHVKHEAADGRPAGVAAVTCSAAHTSSAAEAAQTAAGQEAGSASAAGTGHSDREKDRSDRDRDRERDRSGRDKDSKDKDKDKDKERGREKDRERSRDKDKDKDREKDREREKDRDKEKDRDRDRHRSSKDKDKEREKDKDKDKDKDRDHSHRSSRRDRDRDRDRDADGVKLESAAAAAAAADGGLAFGGGTGTGRLTEEVASCLSRGRLVLVVDLDGVMADSIWDAQLDGPTAAALARRGAVEAATLPEDRRELFRLVLDGAPLWLKLRPGARAFLSRASERFELWARTRQGRPYADALVELLDPSQQLFGSRVVAQGVLAKRLLSALDARAPVAAVLDTPDAAWMGEALGGSLLPVPPYSYFAYRPCSAAGGAALAASGMAGRSLLEVDRDECPERGVLAAALPLLESLHGRVITAHSSPSPASAQPPTPASSGAGSAGSGPSLEPWDVRRVLREQRERVLAGAHICFSRVFAGGAAAAARHPLWRLAEACGAVCSASVSESTTHVVSTSGATEKALWAQQNGRFVVYPSWLECSCYMWRKADEALFLV